MKRLLSNGVYCFVCEKTKLIYVGCTDRSFLIRFIEHLKSDKTWINEKKRDLLLSDTMEFKILENLERRNKFMHLANERYYSEYYKNQGYTVIKNTYLL